MGFVLSFKKKKEKLHGKHLDGTKGLDAFTVRFDAIIVKVLPLK